MLFKIMISFKMKSYKNGLSHNMFYQFIYDNKNIVDTETKRKIICMDLDDVSRDIVI